MHIATNWNDWQKTPRTVRRTAKATLALDVSGTICDCDAAVESVLGYRRTEIVGQHVSVVLPELRGRPVMDNDRPSARLRFLTHIGRCFQVLTRSGEKFFADLFFCRPNSSEPACVWVIVRRRAQ